MTIAYRSSTKGTGVGSGFGTINAPASIQDDDLLVCAICMDGSATGNTCTPSAGWTSLGTAPHPTYDGQYIHAFWKKAASEPGSWTFSTNLNATNDYTYEVAAYTGVDTTTALDASAVTTTDSNGNSSPVSLTLTGITTVTANAMVLYIGGGDPDQNTGSWSAPSGFDSRESDYTNYAPLILADKIFAATGATGSITGTLTVTGGAAGFGGFVVALRPAAGGGDTNARLIGSDLLQSGLFGRLVV